MRLHLDATGRFLGATADGATGVAYDGEAETVDGAGLAPADIATADAQAAAASVPSELWYDKALGKLAVRAATLSPAQAQRQTDIVNLRAYAALTPGTATAAQTQGATQALIRLMRDVVARLQ